MTEAEEKHDKFQSFKEFYPYYLSEHADENCRRLHYFGTTLTLIIIGYAIYTLNPLWLLFMPVAGYSCAWVGHFFIEKNKPATFTYPFWSLLGDYVMYFSWLTGRLPKQMAESRARFG